MFDIFNSNLNQNTSDEDVREFISNNEETFFEEIEKITDDIKDGKDKSEWYASIREDCNNESFCNIVIDIISSQLEPFEDMQYLRNLDYSTFEKIIEYMFNNTILKSELFEVVQKETELSEDDIEHSVKLLNTLREWVIIRRYTDSRFHHELYDMFRFDNEKSNYLLKLYTDQMQTLTNIALLDNIELCKNMKNDVAKLLDIFKNVFEDDISDED